MGGGLYLSRTYNKFNQESLEQLSGKSYKQILLETIKRFTGGCGIDYDQLEELINQRFDFEPVLSQVNGYGENVHMMDLNQGPTGAFKDFGANTLSVLLEIFLSKANQQRTVVVATSGDTGAAVANACKSAESDPNIRVVVLFPKGMITEEQRVLMTTLPREYPNIHCLEVDSEGGFDDCQAWVKATLSDDSLSNLTTANSINIARIIGQSAYTTWCQSQFPDQKMILSVPSGNLGNATGAYFAKEMGGANIEKIILAQNINGSAKQRILQQLLSREPRLQSTMSSAMDIVTPSNLERILYECGARFNSSGAMTQEPNYDILQRLLFAESFDDKATADSMRYFTNNNNGTIICPHTSVASAGLINSYTEHPEYEYSQDPKIIYSTASPAKFPEVIQNVYGRLPDEIEPIRQAKAKAERYGEQTSSVASLNDVRKYLIENGLTTVRA